MSESNENDMKLFDSSKNKIANTTLIILAIVIGLDGVVIVLNITTFTTEQLQLIVTSITAITTIAILLWALSESKRNNRIIMYQNKIMMAQPIYDGFTKNIYQMHESGKELVFSDLSNKVINQLLSLDAKEIDFSNFTNYIDTPLIYIVDNKYYNKYIQLLSKGQSIKVEENDIDEVDKLISQMFILFLGFRKTRYWFRDIVVLYYSILESEFILKQQKKQLFLELDRLCSNYLSFCEQALQFDSDKSVSEDIMPNFYKAKRLILEKGIEKTTIIIFGEFLEYHMKLFTLIKGYKTQLTKIKE